MITFNYKENSITVFKKNCLRVLYVTTQRKGCFKLLINIFYNYVILEELGIDYKWEYKKKFDYVIFDWPLSYKL